MAQISAPYKISSGFLIVSLFLTACGASATPTAGPTEAPPQATASPTPEPSATPAPQPIVAANVGKLKLVGTTDLQRKHLADLTAKKDAIVWSADGAYLIVQTDLGIDVLDGKTLELVAEHPSLTFVNALSSGEVAVLQEHALLFMNPKDGKTTEKGTVDNLGIVAVSPDGQKLAFVTGENTYTLVDLGSGNKQELKIERNVALNEILNLTFRSDSAVLIAQAKNNLETYVILLDLASGAQGGEFASLPAPAVRSGVDNHFVYVDKKGIYLVHPRNDGTGQLVQGPAPIYFYERDNAASLKKYSPAIRVSTFTDPSKLAVLYGVNKINFKDKLTEMPGSFITLYDMETITPAGQFNHLGDNVPLQFGFAPDGSRFYTVSFDGVIRLWDGEKGDVLTVSQPYATGLDPALSPDGSKIAIPAHSGFSIVDSATLETVKTYTFPEQIFYQNTGGQVKFVSDQILDASTTGPQLLDVPTISFKAYTYIWNLSSGEVVRTLEGANHCIFSQNNEKRLCDKEIYPEALARQLFSVDSGDLLLSAKPEALANAALSPDGTSLAACAAGGTTFNIILIKTNASKPYNGFPCQDMRYTPDGSNILLADGTLVSVETREAAGKFAFPQSYTQLPQIYYSPDGDFVVIGKDIYDASTGELLTSLEGPKQVYGAALVDNGMTLLVLSERGVERWAVQP